MGRKQERRMHLDGSVSAELLLVDGAGAAHGSLERAFSRRLLDGDALAPSAWYA